MVGFGSAGLWKVGFGRVFGSWLQKETSQAWVANPIFRKLEGPIQGDVGQQHVFLT